MRNGATKEVGLAEKAWQSGMNNKEDYFLSLRQFETASDHFKKAKSDSIRATLSSGSGKLEQPGRQWYSFSLAERSSSLADFGFRVVDNADGVKVFLIASVGGVWPLKAQSLSSIRTVPKDVDLYKEAIGDYDVSVGRCYAVRTGAGQYAVIRITKLHKWWLFFSRAEFEFEWKFQANGSNEFR